MAHSSSGSSLDQRIISLVLIAVVLAFYLPGMVWDSGSLSSNLELLNSPPPVKWRENFATYFVSIVLEAAPYMMIGALVSGLIEVWVPQGLLPLLARRLGWLGIPLMALLAPLFPICECGVLIVARKLLTKGLPLPHVVTYLLAAPVLNPVVLGSTWLAFYRDPLYPLLRAGGGLLVPVAMGLLVSFYPVARALLAQWRGGCSHGCCGHGDHQTITAPAGVAAHSRHVMGHVRDDFLEIAAYFLMGVFLASALKTFVPYDMLDAVGSGPVLGPAVMMFMAFVMSLCSEADAFLAASFVEFDMFSHTAFLVFGPMLDIKLVLMYMLLFQRRFIAIFSVAVTLMVGLYIAMLRLVPEWVWDLVVGSVTGGQL
ncbi:MAG: permease [Magnetococcus sp. WYHC-3]